MSHGGEDNIIPGGHPGNRGNIYGTVPKAAREYVKKLCGDKLYDQLWKIGKGDPINQYVNRALKLVPAPINVQVDCLKYLADRADGKCATTVDGEGMQDVIKAMMDNYRPQSDERNPNAGVGGGEPNTSPIPIAQVV